MELIFKNRIEMVVCASYEYSRVKDREDPFTTHVAKWNDSQPTGK